MTHNPFSAIREGCRSVAERSTDVRINRDMIGKYTESLPLERLLKPEHDAGSHYLNHADDTAAFFIILDSINFGSGYFPHLHKRPGMSGYFTIASSLSDHFREYGVMTANSLSDLTPAKCTRIFSQDFDNESIQELMALFARALNDLGRFLLEQYRGEYIALIEDTTGLAARLVDLLTQMPFYRDEAQYADITVPFYKRAQLMAADLALAFNRTGTGHFTDLADLTIFADNLVPHVLRLDGILAYSQQLADRIDGEELIPAGSTEEVEIRACALHTVELLARELQSRGHDIMPMELDYLLWNRGQEPYYKRTKPRHRTRSVFY